MKAKKAAAAKVSKATPEAQIVEDQVAGTAPEVQERVKSPTADFPIVGIGASAGGLEALEQFLRNVPENSGIAIIIIQHQDPDHEGMLPELLQRVTKMKVSRIVDRMRVKPNGVYVIPSGQDLSILHGVLHLFTPNAPRGLRLPIDFFFRSLADDRQAHSVGVILSGMGSDGTLGIKAIKELGGLVLTQEPASAKFDSMPRCAIESGMVDIVAPVGDLPGKIIDYLRHGRIFAERKTPLEEKDQSALEKALILIRTQTGQDFSLYKKSTIYRRIERRMGIHSIDKIAIYVRYLQDNPPEVELLFKELLIGVTSFFRDQELWEHLGKKAIPAFLATTGPARRMLRAWSVGCSTGEEAYSLAITFKEALEQHQAPAENFTLQIFATDLDQAAINKARQGIYLANIATDISPERLQRFFVKEGNSYRVCKEIREMVTFATQNVVMQPPFTKLDILICRNLLIYFTPELQKKLVQLFHYTLNPGGFLFLGSAETIGTFTNLFSPMDAKARIFRRSESLKQAQSLPILTKSLRASAEDSKDSPMLKSKPAASLQSLVDKLLLQHYSPPAVLTNDQGDILYISARTGKYLEPAVGKANLNIFAMAREGLRFALGSAFHKAVQQKEVVSVRNIKVGTNGGTQFIDITVREVEEPEALRGMVMIIFSDVAAPPKRKRRTAFLGTPADTARVLEMEREIQGLREELQTTREEMQSSHEELTSTNEELQSINEELQSTNEELTTSREELQSMNEELQTVNAEQRSKMEEVDLINNDMKNLLNSTEIITVFLDNQLKIRRFTTRADTLFRLVPSDLGRPLSDIVSNLHYPELYVEAKEVLQTLDFTEKQFTTNDGSWFSVRIMPYRITDNVVDGVVITFSNITAAKVLEAKLREKIKRLEETLEAKN